MKRPGEIDWREIKRRLMHGGMKLRPWEIQRLTLAEVVLALDEDIEKPRPPTGSKPLRSHAEQVAYVEWVRGLTLVERIEAYQDGRL